LARTPQIPQILGAMSAENVAIVERALDHFTKTGQPYRPIMDDGTEIFDHDIPDARNPYRGLAGVDERGDGIVWTFRNGKLARLDYFNDQDQALEAAGLQDEA
jgi:hypothetical protein